MRARTDIIRRRKHVLKRYTGDSPQSSVFRAVRLGLLLAGCGLRLVLTAALGAVRPVFRRTVMVMVVMMVMMVLLHRVAGPFVPVARPGGHKSRGITRRQGGEGTCRVVLRYVSMVTGRGDREGNARKSLNVNC